MTQSVAAAAETVATMSREPDVFGHKSSYHGHGSFVAQWTLADYPDGSKSVASVTVHHFGNRKQYHALMNRVGVSYSNGFEVETSSPMDATRIAVKPVGRYSRKSHEAFAREVIALVQSGASGELGEKIAQHFVPARSV